MPSKSIGLIAALILTSSAAARPIPVPNAGFEEGSAGQPPPGWHSGISAEPSNAPAAYRAVIDRAVVRSGHSSVRLESPTAPTSEFGTVTNSLDAAAYRGRRIRLTGAVRAEPGDDGQIGLWLRVDRPDGLRGFFDNMARRPITDPHWADYSIEGDVAPDATKLVFGLLLVGHGKAWLDDVRIEDIGPAHGTGIAVGWGNRPRNGPAAGDAPPRPVSRQGLVNLHAFARLYGLVRFFHPSDEAASADWDSLALGAVTKVEPARTSAELAADLRAIFAPVAPSVRIYVTGHQPRSSPRPDGAVSAVRWHHVGFGDDPSHIYSSERVPLKSVGAGDRYTVTLPGGVSAQVPLAVWRDSSGATLPRATAIPLATGKPAGFIPAGFDRTTRLAAVAAAWSMYGQFFPYFDAKTRRAWQTELDPALRDAATAKDDLAFRETLLRLVAALHDGHGTVPYYQPPQGALPLAWDWVQGRLMITASGDQSLKPGDQVIAIDGVAAGRAVAAHAALQSGSPQWTRLRALDSLLTGAPDTRATLAVRSGKGTRPVSLPYLRSASPVSEHKPDPVAELSPGVFYIDVDRVTHSGFEARVPDLAKALGLIFDLRGYPRMPPEFLGHFSDRRIKSGHFVSLAFDHPDRPGVPVGDGQWTLEPLAPRFTSNVVVITNASAISYSESILGVIAGNHLADIVGEPSAGANGNITLFDLPGGYQASWTGMRVTNLDGSRHYLVGIRPTILVSRTIAGIRTGRDELLDRAVALVKSRIRAAD
jgi:C-terminal processing protease CtpA/Prc